MVLVSPNAALAIFGVIVVISAIIAWQMESYGTYDKHPLHTFVAILAGLGVFVTFMFYYNVVQIQEQQQLLNMVKEVARVNDNMLKGVLTEINRGSKTIPGFVASLTPLTNQPTFADALTTEASTEKMVLSFRIFSLWQEVILSNQAIKVDLCTYICSFLQNASSSQLHDEWTKSKINFYRRTQLLGDLLFEYALPITEHIPESYIGACHRLMDDQRCKDIFES